MKRSTASKETKKALAEVKKINYFTIKCLREVRMLNTTCKDLYKIKPSNYLKVRTMNTDQVRVWVSWKVRIGVQEILLQSKWQRNQGDFPIPS